MKPNLYNFEAEIQLYSGHTEWQYVLLPADVAEKVRAQGKQKKGTDAILVEVTVDDTNWHTKLFEHKQSKSFLLPLRTDKKSKYKIGDMLPVQLLVLG